MKTALRLLGFLRPLVGAVALSAAAATAAIAANIGLLGTSAFLIATAALHPSVAVLQVAIVGVRFFGIARSGLRYLERLASHSANFRLLAGLRTWFYRRIEPLAPARLVESGRGDLLDRVVADVDNLEDFYVRAVAPPLTALLVTLGIGIFLGINYPQLAAILVVGLALSGSGVPWLARRLSRGPGLALVAERGRLTEGLVDGIQGMADLLTFGGERDYLESLRIAGENAGQAQVRLAASGGLAEALNGLVSNLTLWGVFLLAIPLVRAGGMDGVTLAVVTLVTLAAFEATLPLGAAAQRLEGSLQSARRLFEVADASPAVAEPPNPAPPPGDYHLEIRDLSFRYSAGLAPALDRFSLSLPPGKRVGIVGESGAGKSTLFNLLLRFWEPSGGSLRLDGRELSEYASRDVRAGLAAIGAGAYLFSGTVRANLLLARPDAAPEEIELALQRVCLADWVRGLPQGLDTWIGERGMQISGGERQRLAVARALLQDAQLWLLDEPTAHLDPHNRRAVAETLETVTRGSSLIWVSHDLAELGGMDEIIVMQAGRAIERGTPQELLRAGGWYARWNSDKALD